MQGASAEEWQVCVETVLVTMRQQDRSSQPSAGAVQGKSDGGTAPMEWQHSTTSPTTSLNLEDPLSRHASQIEALRYAPACDACEHPPPPPRAGVI